jgi:hypothetical protein
MNMATSYASRSSSLDVNGGVKLDIAGQFKVDGSGAYMKSSNANTMMARLAMNYMAHTHAKEVTSDMYKTVAYPDKFTSVCITSLKGDYLREEMCKQLSRTVCGRNARNHTSRLWIVQCVRLFTTSIVVRRKESLSIGATHSHQLN